MRQQSVPGHMPKNKLIRAWKAMCDVTLFVEALGTRQGDVDDARGSRPEEQILAVKTAYT